MPAISFGAGEYESEKSLMIEEQLRRRGIQDSRVLEAMKKVPRHRFVPKEREAAAYEDGPIPIGYGQTISQPYIVAYMTEALKLSPSDRVLEIGTGSGYQAAVLSELSKEVCSIEIVPELASESKKLLQDLGYHNTFIKHGDGYKGWPEQAPFDAVILTAAPEEIPEALIDQLKTGGRLIAPVGGRDQELVLIHKTEQGARQETLFPVRFVPMVKGRK